MDDKSRDPGTGEGPDGQSAISHPGTNNTSVDPDQAIRPSKASKLVIAAIAVAVVLMVVLHLTGVLGPGTH